MDTELRDLIRLTIQHHSYHVSDLCLDDLTQQIETRYGIAVEKAWMYDEVSK